MSRLLRIRFALFVVLLVLIVAAVLLLPIGDLVSALFAWLGRIGPWGPVLLVLLYVPACGLALPVWPLTMGAGFLFGLTMGFSAALLGGTLGACAAFLVSRGLARGAIEAKVSASPSFRAIDRAVASEGFKLVFLLRLSPAIPYNVLNFLLGVTGVSLRAYALASLVGMMPGALMYVYFGTAMKSAADLYSGRARAGWANFAVLLMGLLATVVVTVLLARMASRAVSAAAKASDETCKSPRG
jgi:uncharacterized membrane protein YdjX (TVP38/TMEM64 family)